MGKRDGSIFDFLLHVSDALTWVEKVMIHKVFISLLKFWLESLNYTWSVQNETELVKYGANEPTQVIRNSGAV
jgi:hypothetical protein